MRYLPMNKKGVSPIIATLLLIVIAVAAAVVTYAFVTGFIGTSSGSANQQGSMSFDSYTVSTTTNQTTIYLRNIGTKALTVGSVYIDGIVGVCNDTTTPILPNAALPLQIISPLVNDTVAHQLKIVCIDGTPLQLSIIKH